MKKNTLGKSTVSIGKSIVHGTTFKINETSSIGNIEKIIGTMPVPKKHKLLMNKRKKEAEAAAKAEEIAQLEAQGLEPEEIEAALKAKAKTKKKKGAATKGIPEIVPLPPPKNLTVKEAMS